MEDKPKGPLDGVRIIELSNIIAGPVACQILGDFGAEIIKLEHPEGGDGLRQVGSKKDGVPLYWKVHGRNKRSVGLYLGDPEAAEIFLKLVETADVVVEGFRTGTMEKWNLGYDRLSAVNPRIILARMTGYGQTGPYSHRPAFGSNIESLSGFLNLSGEPDGAPLMSIYALGDYLAAVSFVSSIMMALYHRDAQGGKGQVIDASIFAPLMTVLTKQITHFDQLGIVESRSGNRSIGSAPRRAFKTKDGKWINMAASTPKSAERIMAMVGRPEFAKEPWFQTGVGRLQHAEILEAPIAAWMAERTREEVLKLAKNSEVTLAPILNIEEAMNDPHVQATNLVTEVMEETLGKMKMPNVLFNLSETPGTIRWAGEELGASTDAVLVDELGIDPETMKRLRDKQVLY